MELESLPERWEMKRMTELCEKITSGGTPLTSKMEYYNGDIPWAITEDITSSDIYIKKTKKKITKKGIDNSSAKLFPKDTLLLTMYGTVGKVAITEVGMATNQAILGLIPKKQVDMLYIYYFLKSFENKWQNFMRTTTQSNINATIVKGLSVPLPPLEEQKKIVEILQFADYLKEKIKEAKDLIDKIVMSVFFEMFGDPAKNPRGWEVKKLNEIADVNSRNLLPESWNDEKEVGFIPMENIDEEKGEIRQIGIKKLSQVRSGKTRFKEKDVLFAKITPCVDNKKVALVRGLPSEVGFGSTEFHVIRAKDGITVPKFLLYLTRANYIREQAILSMTGTSGRKRVPASFLKNFDVPLPSLDLQQEFVEIVSKLEDKRKKMEEAEEKLEMLYRILLKQAFSGKLTEEWRMKGNYLEVC